MNRLSVRQKQNQHFALQPRHSLKKTMTSKKKPQKNQARMSMLPLKRERMSVTNESQIVSSRPSTSVLHPNNNLLNTISHSSNQSFYNSSRKSITKQTIISNLVNKLDEKEEIRSIIQTKLKRNSYGANKQFVYTSDFQTYASNLTTSGRKNFNSTLNMKKSGILNNFYETVTDHQNDSSMELKLQKCQQELAYFKSIVADLSTKVKKLERQPNNCLSSVRNDKKQKFFESQCLNYNECQRCLSCKCNQQKKNPKNLVNISTQTGPFQQNLKKIEQKSQYEQDFFDNLERTLKILDRTKNL